MGNNEVTVDKRAMDSARLDALDDGTNRLIQIDRVQFLHGREGWILREWVPGQNVVSFEGRTLRAVIDSAYPLDAIRQVKAAVASITDTIAGLTAELVESQEGPD